MKDLIIQALEKAFSQLENRVPKTKVQTEYINIDDVNPLLLAEFMRENNIPDNAYFAGIPNSYDSYDGIALAYDYPVETTEKERDQTRNRIFSDIAFKEVYNSLTRNGFKRVGYNTGLLKEFDNTTVYKMFIAKDFDRLVKYYSLPFQKID